MNFDYIFIYLFRDIKHVTRFECDPITLTLFQPKVLEAIDYIRNINKLHPDVDVIYKQISRSKASNIYKTTFASIIELVIDRNLIESGKTASGEESYFHLHEQSNKTVTASTEETFDEVNLSVLTSNITVTPLNVMGELSPSSIPNGTINFFNIDLNTPIPSSPHPVGRFDRLYELLVVNKIILFTASLKKFLQILKTTGKVMEDFFKKYCFPRKLTFS